MSLRTPHWHPSRGHRRRPVRALHFRRARTARRSGPNPLKRATDHIQTWAGRLVVALVLLGLPVAVMSVHAYVYHASMHSAHVQSVTRRPATAQVLQSAPLAPAPANAAVQVRVTGAGRAPYTTTDSVAPGTPAGSVLNVWVDDRTGAIVSAPLTPTQASHDAALAAATVVPALPLAAFGLWLAVRWALDRVRAAQWDEEWRRVEPGWSGRYRDRS